MINSAIVDKSYGFGIIDRVNSKRNLIIAIAVVVVILGIVGFFIVKSNRKVAAPTTQSQGTEETQVQTIDPSALGLTVQVRPDKKAIKFALSKVDGIKSIEYQLSYTKEIEGQDVDDALIGTVDIKSGASSAGLDDWRIFGTCSSGVCRYDTVVSDVKLTLKITKDDGTILQAEKTIPLQ